MDDGLSLLSSHGRGPWLSRSKRQDRCVSQREDSPQDRQLGTRAECLVSLGTVGGCTGNNKSGIVEARGIGNPSSWGID